jgi:pilus assembly protein CpaF
VRRIVSVAEVIGMSKDGEVMTQELFTFKQIGVSPEGKAVGFHTALGALPMRAEHLRAEGEEIADSLFAPVRQPSPDKLY